jgi:hypothetical protein
MEKTDKMWLTDLRFGLALVNVVQRTRMTSLEVKVQNTDFELLSRAFVMTFERPLILNE